MHFIDLKKELDAGKGRNLYVFTGEDRGVMSKYLARLEVTASYDDLSLALPALTSTGLFALRRCVSISGGFEDFDYAKLKLLSRNNIIIIIADSIDKRKKFYKDAANDLVEFTRLSADQLSGYVQSQLRGLPVYSEEAYYVISELCHNEVLRIDNECDKLYHLGKEVTLELLKQMITPFVEDHIFELADAIIKRDVAFAYNLVTELRALKTADMKMTVIIYGRFQQLLLIQVHNSKSDSEIAKITALNPWAIKMCRHLVNERSNKYLAQGLKKIYAVENGIKSGTATGDVLFNHLLYTLLREDE